MEVVTVALPASDRGSLGCEVLYEQLIAAVGALVLKVEHAQIVGAVVGLSGTDDLEPVDCLKVGHFL